MCGRVIGGLGIVLSLSLSSCTIGFDSFFTKNTAWSSGDGRLIVYEEGKESRLGYGKMEVSGAFVPAVCNFFYSELILTLENGNKCFWDLNRIKNGAFSYADDSFAMKNCYNYTGDPSWDGSSCVMTGAAIGDEELDAKYFYYSDFINDSLGVRLDFLTSPDEAGRTSVFTYRLYGTYGSADIVFSFGDGGAFSIEDGASHASAGTYSSRPDGIDLFFVTDGIFSLQGQSMALSIAA
jgi:hypothetical protein